MAIFLGPWEDGDGEPFDRTCYISSLRWAPANARRRPRRPHQAKYQKVSRLHLGSRGRQWAEVLNAAQRALWDVDAARMVWPCRFDDAAVLDGHHHFLQSVMPPTWWGEDLLTIPNPAATPWLPIDSAYGYNPATNIVRIWHGDPAPPPVTNWSACAAWQVWPHRAGTTTERRFTRLLHVESPWPQDANGGMFECPPAWPSDDPTGIRLFVRTWYYQCTQNYGPFDSVFWP